MLSKYAVFRRGSAGFFLNLFLVVFLVNCAGGKNGEHEKEARYKPVPVDSLLPYRQTYLRVRPDTIRNCDTNSDYKLLIKDSSVETKAGEYDRFTTQGFPILWFTFLKNTNDSLYFIGTIARDKSQNAFSSLCIEKKYLIEALVEIHPDSTRHEHKKGFGGMGRRRRGGGM